MSVKVSVIYSHTCIVLKCCSLVFFLTLSLKLAAHKLGKDSLFSIPTSNQLNFQENLGQIETKKGAAKILFKAELNGTIIYVTEKGLTYFFLHNKQNNSAPDASGIVDYSYDRFDIDLEAASVREDNIIKEGASPEKYNFFYGHCPNGIFGVKQYAKLTVRNVYPNIDWVIYGSEKKGLKYDFIIHPGADEKKIKLIYKSLNKPSIRNGTIYLPLSLGEFRGLSPVTFLQESKLEVESHFQIKKQTELVSFETSYYETEIGFTVQPYDKNKTLVIDPLQLWWGTYYGGTAGSEGISITSDTLGNVFVLGNTLAIDLPLQPYGSLAYFQSSSSLSIGSSDCFILKFTDSGQLLWATYFGGSAGETASAIACDKSGNIFLTGSTESENFPVKNAGGNCFFKDSLTPLNVITQKREIFVSKFSNNGHYLWGTYYFANNSYNNSNNLAVDSYGSVYITGSTGNTFDLYNPGGGAFFDNTLGYSTDHDVYILKFSNSGQRLLATYYGGSSYDDGYAVATDGFGNAYFTGATYSTDLYLKNPGGNAYFQSQKGAVSTDGFILKLDKDCKAVWSSYIGGNSSDIFRSIVCDKEGNVFLAGGSGSSNLPIVNPGNGALSLPITNGSYPMILFEFNKQSQIVWSTHLAGSVGGGNITIGKCQEIYLSLSMSTPCSNCPPIQLMNPGNGTYYDSLNGSGNSNGTLDMFMLCFTNKGVLRWGTFFGGDKNDIKMAITCSWKGDVFYTGDQGSRGYTTNADLQSYFTSCLTNPGGSAYFQPVPIGPFGFNAPYCVVGKFTGPSPSSTFLTSGCGSTNSASIQSVSGWGPYTYTWSTGSHTDSIANIPQGMYSYTIADAFFGCLEETTVFVGLPSLALTVDASNVAICKGQSTQLSATGANSFSWSPPQNLSATSGGSVYASPLITTNYTVTGFNSPTCKVDTMLELIVYPLPTITVSGKDTVCSGSSVNLSAAGALQFSWTPSASVKSSTNNIAEVNPMENAIYTIIGKDNQGCVDSVFFKLKVLASPKLEVKGSYSVCAGSKSSLLASGAQSFQWEPASIISQPDSAVVIIAPQKNISYTVTGTNYKVCKSSVVVPISVLSLPKVSITAPDSSCADLHFALSADGNGSFNWWSSGSLDCASCQSTKAKINSSTRFFVRLTDTNACFITDSVEVFLIPDCEAVLNVPNIFSPNNDGINDFFKLSGKNFTSFTCYVFNRWGTQLYFFDKIEGFWNGITMDGKNCAEGTYFYLINVKDLYKKEHLYKGPLQLVR